MLRGFVIGNGESRLSFSLDKLRGKGPIYGCNALYRDFIPDVLVAVDERMIKELDAVTLPANLETIYRVWEDYERDYRRLESSTGEVLDDPGYGAGCIAADIMCRRGGVSEIFLVGFDIYSKNGKVNNVYKDTNNYKTSEAKATYSGNWTRSLRDIFLRNPHITFFRVSDDEFNSEYQVPAWLDIVNIRAINYETLERFIG